jgi:hypothetical protein
MRLSMKSFRTTDFLFLILAAGMVVFYVLVSGGGFPLDDAWIHQVYGRNLAQNGRWEFTVGEPSAASTSPLFTVILAVGYKLGISYTVWAHATGTLALAVTAILGSRLADRLAPNIKHLGLLTGVALIIAWHNLWAAASGMETMIFGAFTLVVVTLAWRELDNRSTAPRDVALRGLLFGIVGGLTTLTRPEGIILLGLVGLAMLIVQPQGSFTRLLLWGAVALVSFFAVLAPYLIINLQITGGLMPDTAAAKRAGIPAQFALPYLTRVRQMVVALLGGAHTLLVPGMSMYLIQLVRRRDRNALLYAVPLIWGVGLFFVYAGYLPAPYHHGRYVMPAVPSLVITGMVGTAWLLQAGQKSLVGRVLTRALAISTALAFVYFGFVAGPMAYRTDVRIIEEEMVTAAHWIAENLPPDDMIVLHDIGAVGYFSPRPILDVAGLITPDIVPYIGDIDGVWQFIYERDARYIAGFVDQLPGGNVNDPRYCRIFATNGETTQDIIKSTAKNFDVYQLTWDGVCPSESS